MFEWCSNVFNNYIVPTGTPSITCKIQGVDTVCFFIGNIILFKSNSEVINFKGNPKKVMYVAGNYTNGVMFFDFALYNVVNNIAYNIKLSEWASTNIEFRNNVSLVFPTFGDFTSRPKYINNLGDKSPYNYSSYYDTTLGKYIYAKKVGNGIVTWVDEKGYTAAINRGTTAQRPTSTLTTSDAGYQYFDTDLSKPIYLKVENTGTSETPVWVKSWVDATGATV